MANTSEQKTLRLIVKYRKKRLSLREIGRKLEAKGYKTKRGKSKWHPQTLSQIINSKVKRAA